MQKLPSISTVLIVLVLCPRAAVRAAFAQEAEGTVSGHVYCADTNAPARLARVMLEPVADVSKAAEPHNTTLSTMNSVQTGLDGSFAMKDVKPGAYYVIAEMPGYLSSLSELGEEDWEHPTASVAARMAKMLQRVSVEAGRTAIVNLSLERGAVVSGMVSFDDGSPAVGVHIKALRAKSDGSWETVRLEAIPSFMGVGSATNDLGQYRISGLTAGRYVIEARLFLSDINVTGFMGRTTAIGQTSQYSLSFFSGGYLRARDDAAFTLRKADSRMGEDIVIPLSKLHSVSGTVIAARDGHALTAGEVSLLYGDDKKLLATAAMDQSSGEYRFYFVPEGHFILEVAGAGDSTQTTGGTVPKNTYGQLQQPLDITGDVDGLVLSVPSGGAVAAVPQNSNKPQ